jgi:protein Mpv17
MRLLRRQLTNIWTGLDRRALAKDVATAGALGCVGDFICQGAVEQRHTIDWRRFVSVGSFEAIYIGGFFHFLCQAFPPAVCAVGRALEASSARSGVGAALQVEGSSAHALGCSLADNVHDGSLMIPSYFVGVGLMQGDALYPTLRNLRREWLASYLAGCSFWIPVMWLNFRVVPAPYRVRVMAVSNTCWSVIIDFLAHRSRGDVT